MLVARGTVVIENYVVYNDEPTPIILYLISLDVFRKIANKVLDESVLMTCSLVNIHLHVSAFTAITYELHDDCGDELPKLCNYLPQIEYDRSN